MLTKIKEFFMDKVENKHEAFLNKYKEEITHLDQLKEGLKTDQSLQKIFGATNAILWTSTIGGLGAASFGVISGGMGIGIAVSAAVAGSMSLYAYLTTVSSEKVQHKLIENQNSLLDKMSKKIIDNFEYDPEQIKSVRQLLEQKRPNEANIIINEKNKRFKV